ncbi:MAG TPA: alkaline phosphatase family protein, partial [Chitinophagaceae bacterium]|nr:alkaline phosphatase family protein [Chitinophagaceae bacterium]
MKPIIIAALCACFMQMATAQPAKEPPNIFIITIDGFRWQEIFDGADPALLSNPAYVKDASLLQDMYGGDAKEIRRKNLLPFFWTSIAHQGQLYGNRNYNNRADVKNFYKISYAGYNEIFTGYADPALVPNTPRFNNNANLPGYLNTLAPYKDKCVVFSSWNIFPYILNEGQNNLPVNSGYEHTDATDSAESIINEVQDSIHEKKSCRYDALTFLMAKQYMQQQHPKLMVIGFGETDEFAHSSRYDMYLQRANDIDRMIAELWYSVQTDPFYKNNTTFIITTDHGRGKKNNTWPGHHLFIKGSG